VTLLTVKTFSRWIFGRGLLLVPALAIALSTGCKKEAISVYRVPKEQPPGISQAAPAAPGRAAAPSGRPQIGWRTPEGWVEQPPDGTRVVSFTIKGEGTNGAIVAALPFAGMAGTDLQFVNLWRETIKLAPITESELGQHSEDVSVGGAPAKLFDVYAKSSAPAQPGSERIMVAVLRSETVTWFFKLAGDAALVAREKPKFLQFLASIDFRAPSPSAVADVPPPSADSSGKPAWQVPATWKEIVAGQMLLAKFQLSESPKTEVTVSVFPGDVGGLLANVNRWRSQVHLPAVDSAGLAQVVTPLDASGAKAMLVDMAGQDASKGPKTRIVGVIVPRNGQTWFYKMMGDDQVAEREKPAFLSFVQSVKYSDAR
jgi:hypothetical protein